MRERNISDLEVKETVLHPSRAVQQEKGIRRGAKWTFKKESPGYGCLEVVAEFAQDTCYIETVYWTK